MIVAQAGEARVLDLLDRLHRLLELAGADIAPGCQQDRSYVALAPDAGLAEAVTSSAVVLLLEGAQAEDEMGKALGLVETQHTPGIAVRIGQVAVGQGGDKGALQQLAVFWILAQDLAEEGGSSKRVAVGIGNEGGEVVACLAGADLEGSRDGHRLPRLGHQRGEERGREGQGKQGPAVGG